MGMFRSAANRAIDAAHNRIACAEMLLDHSSTDADRETAQDELSAAQRYLQRACDARDTWNATEHDDYEVYPEVPYDDQMQLAL